jgi:hypothetical protein
MSSTPKDPFTQLQESAANLHEYFMSLMEAGFERHEALYLVGQVLQAGIGKQA